MTPGGAGSSGDLRGLRKPWFLRQVGWALDGLREGEGLFKGHAHALNVPFDLSEVLQHGQEDRRGAGPADPAKQPLLMVKGGLITEGLKAVSFLPHYRKARLLAAPALAPEADSPRAESACFAREPPVYRDHPASEGEWA